MSSWYDSWADRYAESSTGVSADVPFYVGLACEAEGPLVELAVGTGRVAIPVAQATGRLVVGIDSSRGMLAQARLRAVEQGVEFDLREGDMRDLELEEPVA
jgi:ubiquinone/menaquinone biosynthesis C-methylase UbiE